MSTGRFLFTFMLLLTIPLCYGQSYDSVRFESDYRKILRLMSAGRDSLDNLINLTEKNHRLTEIQKSKLYYIKTKVFSLMVNENQEAENADAVIDPAENLPLLDRAVQRIIQSRTAIGIPLLQEYLETACPHSDSAHYATVYLAEGYRKIGEYQREMEIIYELLDKQELNMNNRAFAYNRLAALYDEFNSNLAPYRYDSVFKYSNLCIKISEEKGYDNHLATAQNELGFYYQSKNEFTRALELYGFAFNNFMKMNQVADAINAKYNTARVFYELKKHHDAITVLQEAEKLSKEDIGINIFTKIYLELARNYQTIGENKLAYEYLNIARKMQIDAFKANIRANIYDMSAKYEAEKKEKENLQLRMENEIKEANIRAKNSVIGWLIVGILFTGILLVTIAILFLQKKKALDILVKRNLEIVSSEKEYGLISEQLDEWEKSDFHPNENNNRQNGESTCLKEQLEAFMKAEKPYLFSDISINDISQKLRTNRTYISKLINDYYHKNFNDYINEYRIKTARQLLADPSKNHISIEGIGQMSGFNSRSTFFTCFKKYTGISPSYFRESIK
ncbi:MAG: helix-turn-helix transcriptional regulator [Bacteroidales bacterium]|nr:helix-turn-helix transcriptional regulator [Bacteroidales bacterium]